MFSVRLPYWGCLTALHCHTLAAYQEAAICSDSKFLGGLMGGPATPHEQALFPFLARQAQSGASIPRKNSTRSSATFVNGGEFEKNVNWNPGAG
jgi:hypothetical protein